MHPPAPKVDAGIPTRRDGAATTQMGIVRAIRGRKGVEQRYGLLRHFKIAQARMKSE
jgi:hypothetical protein